jgi:hypothetical protein
MDINNFVQTLIFMNLKDVFKMSFRELFPIILLLLINSYKEHLYKVLKPYIKWNKYKSEIINEIKFCYTGECRELMVNKTDSINPILWKYRRTIEAIRSSNVIKEYKLFVCVEKNPALNHYEQCVYIPDVDTTVKLDEDVYLSFTHSNKDINISKDKSTEEQIITLTLKSKNMDSLSLKKWLDNIDSSYTKWRKEDTNLYLYTNVNVKKDNDYIEKYIFNSTKTFDNLFFEQKELIINRLKQYSDIERYKRLGIPHTIGFLFHGEPGCGKTSCIKAIANHLNRNIITINLKHIPNINHLNKLFLDDYLYGRQVERNKRIYVFEEIDCCLDENNPFLDRNMVVNKKIKEEDDLEKLANVLLKDDKKEIKKTPSITTGEVLELLDGIAETDDRIIIFTTNHPEKIDKAFMRPGRIDVCVEFKKLRRQDINNLYKLWYGKEIGEKALNKIKDYSLSQAEFGKLCFENNAEKVLEKLICGN